MNKTLRDEADTLLKKEVKNPQLKDQALAPGWPGIPAQWNNSTKAAVGTALNPASRVWFTIGGGILTEMYYPRVDQACTRDLGFIVTDGKSFFSEEKVHTQSSIEYIADGIPAFKIINTCNQGNYRIEKEIVSDPETAAILQRVKLIPLKKKLKDLKLFVLLAPHIGNAGGGNTAWLGEHKGRAMLFAEKEGLAISLASSVKWKKRSVGFVGYSDGWQDIEKHKFMAWHFQKAENGNVALTGEIDLSEAPSNGFVLTLAFGNTAPEAGQKALASLYQDFDSIKENYIQEWQLWQGNLFQLKGFKKETITEYLISAAVLRSHESKRRTGGLIASLSIPWGGERGDEEYGGYHLVWPRDLVHIAGGLLALNAHEDCIKALNYLMITQEEDGHWPQNMWLDGTPYWNGVQLDQTAMPILLLDLLHREDVISRAEIYKYWPMVFKAAQYIVCNGPETPQCRWEENAGISINTLATEIAALLAAAEIAELNNEFIAGSYFRETADYWNSKIEDWTYVTGTDLAKKVGVEGYYIRIAPLEMLLSDAPDKELITIVNRPSGENIISAKEFVSPDALALVRYGLRDANDKKILNTIKVLDAVLKNDTPSGPCWYRYNGDGYGEHEDGTPFDGTGKGRLWPLLTGERGHYEVAAGNIENAKKMLKSLENFANEGGMLPEQVWDTKDIPEKELYHGKATGAAMPLAWAHAEYIKLCRSIKLKRIFDLPGQTKKRYIDNTAKIEFDVFRFNHQIKAINTGKKLRIETLARTSVRWTSDQWKTVQNTPSIDSESGMHFTDLPTKNLKSGSEIEFTFFWPETDSWENENFIVNVE